MKKVLIAAGLATALMPLGAHAGDNAASKNSLYFSAGIADTVLEDDNIIMKLGYNRDLGDLVPGVSAEVELTKSFADESSKTKGGPAPIEIQYFAASTFARYDLGLDPLVSGFGVYARAGLAYTNVDFPLGNSTSFDPAYGGGLTYAMTEGSQVYADFTSIDAESGFDEISIGLKARF